MPTVARFINLKYFASVIVVAGCLCASVFWVHYPALSAKALLFDDEQYLTKNLLVQQPSWASAGRLLSEVLKPSTVGGYYQPLTMISLMLDYPFAEGPYDVRPFHRTNLILHIVNTAFVWVFLYSIFSRTPLPFGSRPNVGGRRREQLSAEGTPDAMWPAALTALLFGVHPLTVEPIPWVGERKTLLATFFALICLVLYVRWVWSSSRAAYWGALAAFILAILSKPTVTPLPLLLILLDVWPLRRFSRRTLLERIPFLLLAGVFAVITFVSQSRSAAVQLPHDYGPARIPLVLCHNIVFYLYKIIRPHDLSAHYPYPDPMSLAHPMILAGVIGTGLLLALLVASLRWTRAVAVGWLFFFVAILPTMQIVGFSNVIASDKYAYFPALGICMIVAWLLCRLWHGVSSRASNTVRRIAVAGVVLLLAGAEAHATRSYLSHWKDTETLYRHMIALAPKAAPLYNDLAADAARRGLREEAVSIYHQAIALESDNGWYHSNLGAALFELGKIDEATAEYREALRLHPVLADAANNLGLALARNGQLDEAEKFFRQSLAIRGEAPEVHNNLAALLLLKGKNKEAAEEAAEAVRLKPRHAEAQYNLGLANARQGALEEAEQRFSEAIRLQADYIDARSALAEVCMARRRWTAAADQYREVLRLRPEYEPAKRGLAAAQARQAAETQSDR